eukprot:3885998-Rhodomonas_salina.1
MRVEGEGLRLGDESPGRMQSRSPAPEPASDDTTAHHWNTAADLMHSPGPDTATDEKSCN